MILSRNSFFLVAFCIFLLPLLLYKFFWLANSTEATGTFYFLGHGNLGSVLGISTYPVIWFTKGKDTVYFNGNVNIPLNPNERISVRYQNNDPTNAKVNTFSCIWGDTLAYELAPFLILLVVFFHPDRVPKKAAIHLGKKPFIKFLDSKNF